MADHAQLKYLIRLLEDESEVVRSEVIKALEEYGSDLPAELLKQNIRLDDAQRRLIDSLVEKPNEDWLKEQWPSWFGLAAANDKLEKALHLIAEFQYRRHYPISLSVLLDQLAGEYKTSHRKNDVIRLSEFLFTEKEFKGAQVDYYNPLHNNLNYVIEKRRGIPISLSCLYILVGYRLGLEIEGLNFPGHFLTRAYSGRKRFIVDCFNSGRYVDEQSLERLSLPQLLNHKMLEHLHCEAETIIGRCLRNLTNAYYKTGNERHAELMNALLNMMPKV